MKADTDNNDNDDPDVRRGFSSKLLFSLGTLFSAINSTKATFKLKAVSID